MMNFKHLTLSLGLAATLMTAAPNLQAQAASDQDVVLIADSVFLRGDNQLTARGNVEALRGETRLTASAIIYNATTDQITIEGPIEIHSGDNISVFAEFAELDTAMQNGLLQSARLVMNEQLTINADKIRRVEGKQSILEGASATSCLTCNNEVPLWQIRASRVTHDQEKQQLFFDHAQFRIMDVPVFYLPRLRMPDPTLSRASGFLIPQIRTRSRLGTGIKTPYFIRIGDHKDLTLTPYLSPNTRTLEWRYRQAFKAGDISFSGALSDDNFSGYSSRAYLFGEGRFDLPRDYTLTFDIKLTSDDAYLQEYDYSSLDRLRSELAVERANRTENTRFALTHFESLRPTENNANLPSIVASASKEKRLFPKGIGGELMWQLEAHTHYRRSDFDTDVDADGVVDGRDLGRVNAELEWRDNWVTDSGFEVGTTANLAFDGVFTRQDSTIGQSEYAQITPSVAAHLRYPLVKTSANGVTHLIEPIVQVGWTGGDLRIGSPNTIANDESTRVEFDEGNLLALSRFPSVDRRERGLVGAWGVNWSRFGPKWEAHLTLGQVVRADANSDFTTSSGLSGLQSDFLIAGKLVNDIGINFTARSLIDPSQGLVKAEARGGWNNDRIDLGLSYVWLDADAAENRSSVLAEMNLDSAYRINRHWTGLANWRYDVARSNTAEAGFGLEYRNECVKARFSVSRRFTSSTTVKPSTDLSLTVEILGFSAGNIDKSYARQCSETAG